MKYYHYPVSLSSTQPASSQGYKMVHSINKPEVSLTPQPHDHSMSGWLKSSRTLPWQADMTGETVSCVKGHRCLQQTTIISSSSFFFPFNCAHSSIVCFPLWPYQTPGSCPCLLLHLKTVTPGCKHQQPPQNKKTKKTLKWKKIKLSTIHHIYWHLVCFFKCLLVTVGWGPGKKQARKGEHLAR